MRQRVAWLEDGLHVSLDGAPLVGGVEAGGYHVADYWPQPGWRLALSAHGGYPPGRKWVRGLTLLADADVHVGAGSAAEARLSCHGSERERVFLVHPHPAAFHVVTLQHPTELAVWGEGVLIFRSSPSSV